MAMTWQGRVGESGMDPKDAEHLAGPRVFGKDLGRAKAGRGPKAEGLHAYRLPCEEARGLTCKRTASGAV